ncbi:lysine biosynthesis protein LysW [Actinoplanes sp. NBRC 14428]|uniref:Alpha-aminoadipate carrier protein LysW n=1 Tax=Pseudosporangium ferrugineum TaxID=439699 RepID=A0A2T0RLJ8_9ACTN|nr:lysine biosynthesis protein LysW [Pseudosporangium ferrugineum]PRY22038.1 alpha-aminoadipate carrier protein LysW [Pseudosporangium ferrugineum]BCJ50686.1 lysine biosynthesis protein LysW [Actinoplanes sp. NBRC 14428]
MVTACPECESPVDAPAAAAGALRLSELLECPGCRSELEVIALTPVTLALAPDPEEDWGE